MGRPLALITESLDPKCAAWLEERCDIARASPSDRPRFDELLASADALIVRTYTTVDASLLSRAPRVRVVARAGVGLDNIDVAVCRERGVEVVHTPMANATAVAELVFAFLLDALRPRLFLEEALDTERWKALRSQLIAPRQLEGMTLGILGMGRVGRAVAKRATGFSMRVLCNDLDPIPPEALGGAEQVSLAELLRRAEALSIHIDEREENRSFISAAHFELVRPDLVLINTSRGFVIDTDALAGFLRGHPGAQAILDVHDPEPFPESSPLFGLPNAHLSPHVGAATAPAHERMSWVVRDVWRVLCGDRPEFPAPSRDGAAT